MSDMSIEKNALQALDSARGPDPADASNADAPRAATEKK